MAKKFIVGNWKMNPKSVSAARDILTPLKKSLSRMKLSGKKEVVFCPPAPFMGIFDKLPKGVFLGAEDISTKKEGAFTGEVAASMVKSMGAKYVLVGHSERRAMGDTEDVVAEKIARAFEAGLIPIICLGEKTRDKEGQFFIELRAMIEKTMKAVPKSKASSVILAYEPLWAIGALAAISPELLEETIIFFRRTLSEIYGKQGLKIPIIYGGSVDEKDAAALIHKSRADGLLPGRASLSVSKFLGIIESI